ncbi:hypothetical protein [Chelativorans sp. AA-79]|uniref:hypothetical protein n=1 Tax=Chelativorans sp. AA-79 TaxID=3028735 RepID=UPI0023F8963F|nr:hypothetical protein [Chelativorans sp. AA-79]WEX08011.1 hypothetical protein PVE73_18210 [Chelativorans sp. AA-79]
MTGDAIDLALGLAPGSHLYELRMLRPEFVSGAEACRAAVLNPATTHGLVPELRAALAARMARANADATLTAQYDALTAPALEALAAGAPPEMLNEPEASMARHADLVTGTPAVAMAADLERLSAVGLDNAQIVALSELIAFVNFQTRITQGLRLLGSP